MVVVAAKVAFGRQAPPGVAVDTLRSYPSGHTITAGRLAIRTDEPYTDDTDPTTAFGVSVLMHELGHTIGAGHSGGDLGVMSVTGVETRLSAGDRYVFRLLGCSR